MTDGVLQPIWRKEQIVDGISTLWFNTPGRSQNVLDVAAFEQLDRCLAEVEADRSIQALVVRSDKPGGFCSGADLRTIQGCGSPEQLETFFKRGLAVIDRLANLEIPTVAVVHGACLGGGFELALSCRFRVALASDVPLKLGTPEVQLGLIPGWGAILKLPEIVGPREALDLLLTGNPIGFLQARSLGIVNRLVSQDEPERLAETLRTEPPSRRSFSHDTWYDEIAFACARIAEMPADFPEAQQAILEAIEIDLSRGREAALEATLRGFLQLAFSPSTREAIASFFRPDPIEE